MIRLDLATDAYIGARNQQQDAAGAYGFGTTGGAVLVLGDGLGGHTGGAEASHIVRETFREAAGSGAFDGQPSRRDALLEALERANQRIASGVDPSHGQRGMASTAVAVVVADGHANWISVGDSHLYVWRSGRLAKLNEDHSQAGLMLRRGNYKPDDPEVIAAKSILVSALTGRSVELIDHPTKSFKLQAGDILLLASDGLNTLGEDDIEDMLTRHAGDPASTISTGLLDAVRARRAERQDNTAVVVARILELPDVTASPSTEVVIPTQVTAPTEARAIATVRVDPRPDLDKTIKGSDPKEQSAPSASGGVEASAALAPNDAPTARAPVPAPASRPEPAGAAVSDAIVPPTRPTRPTSAASERPRAAGVPASRILAFVAGLAIAGGLAYTAFSWYGSLAPQNAQPAAAGAPRQQAPATAQPALPPAAPPVTNAPPPTPAVAPPVQLPPVPAAPREQTPAATPQPAAPQPAAQSPVPQRAQPVAPEPTRTPGAGQTEPPQQVPNQR